MVRQCTSFGEAASSIPYERLAEKKIAQFFNSYNGFTNEATIWFAYLDYLGQFKTPPPFNTENVCDEEDISKKIFTIAISPCLLLVNFSSGLGRSRSCEFHHPSVSACQLGFGQLPIHLFFMDLIKPREILTSSLQYGLTALTSEINNFELLEWTPARFSSADYKNWWVSENSISKADPSHITAH